MSKRKRFIPQPKIHQGKIPSSVTEIYDQRDPETQLYRISFKYYNDDECQISILEKNNARRMLLDLRLVGKCTSLRNLHDNNIGVIPISNSGAYKSLFNRLSPDVEIKEHIIQATARMFYFVESSIFNIVAVRNSHIPLGKHR